MSVVTDSGARARAPSPWPPAPKRRGAVPDPVGDGVATSLQFDGGGVLVTQSVDGPDGWSDAPLRRHHVPRLVLRLGLDRARPHGDALAVQPDGSHRGRRPQLHHAPRRARAPALRGRGRPGRRAHRRADRRLRPGHRRCRPWSTAHRAGRGRRDRDRGGQRGERRVAAPRGAPDRPRAGPPALGRPRRRHDDPVDLQPSLLPEHVVVRVRLPSGRWPRSSRRCSGSPPGCSTPARGADPQGRLLQHPGAVVRPGVVVDRGVATAAAPAPSSARRARWRPTTSVHPDRAAPGSRATGGRRGGGGRARAGQPRQPAGLGDRVDARVGRRG